jgi:N-acetylmuramic acid 6-phosphate etherase
MQGGPVSRTVLSYRAMAPHAGLRLTERRNPRTQGIDQATPLEIVDLLAAEDATVPGAVHRAREAIARAIELVEAAFRRGGRLLYVGAGTSGRLGVLDAAECPPTFGTPPEMVVGIIAGGPQALVRSAEGAEDDADAGRAAMDEERVGSRDVVIGIAASGITPYVLAALDRARERQARTGLVTSSQPSPDVLRQVDVCIFVDTGPEAVTGSTRLKAGTATKLVLNTITTGAMVRLGKTYGNLMVDLRVWSDKLQDRGERIVMEVTGADRETARQALAAAGGSARTAIVMVARGLGRAEAEALLARHDNHLRPILGPPPPVSDP